MTLTLRQLERIGRVQRFSRQKVKWTATQKCNAMFAWMGLGYALLILAVLFLIGTGWQPGHQSEIAAEFKAYRSLRHDAVAAEWK